MRALALLLALVSLAACRYESTAAPVSTGGSPQSQPQSPNSLPRGSAVNAPIEPPTGLRTTRVSP